MRNILRVPIRQHIGCQTWRIQVRLEIFLRAKRKMLVFFAGLFPSF
ncbi:hypothetical protein [Alteripontixanthobacter muriae]|nr:hypothetical protein [Alteripontixanthobacter muriae]